MTGKLDILLTGSPNQGGSVFSNLYRNDGPGGFTNIPVPFTGVWAASVAWSDYDNDGRQDLLLTGLTNNGTSGTTRIYHNNGDGTFTDINANIVPVWFGGVAWGDYDNDGRPDIIITGLEADVYPQVPVTKIYHNEGNGVFKDIHASVANLGQGAVAWGDYDNDGYLDFAITGSPDNGQTFVTKIYHNDGLEAARLLRTVRTSRLGRQSASSSGNAVSRLSFTVTSGDEAGCGAATDKASVSAILATCLGSQKHSGGSGCGSWSNVLRWARIRQAFLVSRQPSVVRCTPGPCPGSRVRIRPPSHSTTAKSGGLSGRWAKASAVLGSASRRSASSQPTSCTTRSIVLAEIGWSPTFLITNPARSNERVSAAANVIRWINKGVSSRASNPSVSLSGKRPGGRPGNNLAAPRLRQGRRSRSPCVS